MWQINFDYGFDQPVAQWMSHAKLHSIEQDGLFHQTLRPWGETSIKSVIFLSSFKHCPLLVSFIILLNFFIESH